MKTCRWSGRHLGEMRDVCERKNKPLSEILQSKYEELFFFIKKKEEEKKKKIDV